MSIMKKFSVLSLASIVALTGCVTDPQTGQQKLNKTAMYGLGGAVTCGIVGALTHGSKGARNSAAACGAIGVGIGAYMDHQEKVLRESLSNSGVEVERVGDQIKLIMPENITFATGSSVLDSKSTDTLGKVANVLATYTDTTITVAGHTDSTGSDSLNQRLSEERATAVSHFLSSHNVEANRIAVVGYGPRQPIANNSTADGRAQNRRVEIMVNPKVQ